MKGRQELCIIPITFCKSKVTWKKNLKNTVVHLKIRKRNVFTQYYKFLMVEFQVKFHEAIA